MAGNAPLEWERREMGFFGARGLRASDFGVGKIEYFAPADFGRRWQSVKADTAYKADRLARALSVPIKITSAFRTPEENKAAGGSPDSEHLRGVALDLWFSVPDFWRRAPSFIEAARRIGFRGIGVYEGKPLLHVDTRDAPGSWAKTASGKFVSLGAGLKRFAKSPAAWLSLALAAVLVFVALGKARREPGA